MRLDQRVPEPELMEEPARARAYSEADFAAAHQGVVDDLVARHPHLVGTGPRVVDLGCGPADVTARLALALPDTEVVGLDAGPRMLAHGRDRLGRLGLTDRVRLIEQRLPAPPEVTTALGRFDLVASNSLLHHLDDPSALWAAVTALAAPGAVVHVADLCRPADDAAVERLVEAHADGEPPVLVEDLRASLRAAYRPDEVRAQLDAAGLAAHLAVEATSDRHLVVTGRLP